MGALEGRWGTPGRSEVLRHRDDAGRDDDIKNFPSRNGLYLEVNANYLPEWEKGVKLFFFGPKISRPLPKPVSHLVDSVGSGTPLRPPADSTCFSLQGVQA
jgi:hypothetical protein